MYTELTKEERNSILGNENFKGTFVCCDSPYCDYCARKLFHDPEFDHGECETCEGASNFLGIQCITWGGDE